MTSIAHGSDLEEPLLRALREDLERARADWEGRGFRSSSRPGLPGALYRIGDALARSHGVPVSAKLVVLRNDATGVLTAPFSIDAPVEEGDVLIPVAVSPYGIIATGTLSIHLWARASLPLDVLGSFRPIGSCPAVAELPPRLVAHGATGSRRPVAEAWRSLLTTISAGCSVA